VTVPALPAVPRPDEEVRPDSSRAPGGAADERGASTLQGFARAPRINAWLYGKLRQSVRGDVLEIGSGIGNLSRLILRDAERAVLTDVDTGYLATLRDEVAAAGERASIAVWNVDEPPPAPLRERRFDAVVAANVIEHLEDDVGAVRRLASMLRAGGTLLIYVPACPFAFGTLDEGLGHHRRYTRRSLERLLDAAGLSFARPRYMNRLGLLGWLWQGRVMKRRALAPWLIAAFERLVGVARALDFLSAPLPVGLGLVVHARLGQRESPGVRAAANPPR
jgi:SAM-dependent methyltransferase